MDITPYVEGLRRDLLAAAEAAGPEARAVAERLSYALDPAARLALMEAVSQAAAEITAEMPTGGVDVRLHGRDLDFAVHAPAPSPAASTATAPDDDDAEDDAVARITLRLPESLKTRAEDLAGRAGHSLNTWLVNAIRTATRENAVTVDVDLSSLPLGGGPFGGKAGRRMSGWI